MNPSSAAVTPERIMKFSWSYVPPLVLEAGIRHHVFDVLDAGPKTVKETAEATGASERGLRAIMNVLVGLEFLAKGEGGRYALTPESAAFLVSTKPGFQGGLLTHASRQLIPNWLHLTEVVATGKP
ncbi:MAG: methyltransferase dimerization domain-containing protein, partial [Edaphobacter sp.]